MSTTETLPAPELRGVTTNEKWLRERQAFREMLPELIARHPGKYVAVHAGRVVGTGDDPKRLAIDAYAAHGYVAIFVGLASESAPRLVRIPTPRLIVMPAVPR